MQEPKFIVVHDVGESSTGASAKGHINWLNTDENALATTAYVDSKSVYQALDLSTVGFGVGNGNNGVKNNNSYSIEMTRATTKELQLKTIENTRLLIEEIKELFPHVKVVYHKEASHYSKDCPNLIYGDNPMFTEEELNNLLGI